MDEHLRAPDEARRAPTAFDEAVASEPLAVGELWRIEGAVSALRQEIVALGTLGGPDLAILSALGRRWRDAAVRALPAPLSEELCQLLAWLGPDTPSPAEVRVGLAQLEGWIDGVLLDVEYAMAAAQPAR